jgi:hypothetical protein
MRDLIERLERVSIGEDALGFTKRIGDLVNKMGPEKFSRDLRGQHGDPRKTAAKPAQRALKRVFQKEADHAWLSKLNTVHWAPGSVKHLFDLLGKGRDELSTSMTLPGESLGQVGTREVGLWVKGRITLAANNMDRIWSGHYSDYMGYRDRGPTPQQSNRAKTSGVNKLPRDLQNPEKWGRLAKGIERKAGTLSDKKMLDMILRAGDFPYVLDKRTWSPDPSSNNEALVDNWKAVGIVVDDGLADFIREGSDFYSANQVKEVAGLFGIPVYDLRKKKIWSPDDA